MIIQKNQNKGITNTAISITILTVAIIGGLIFGEYYYFNKKSQQEKSKIQIQINSLQKEKEELEKEVNDTKQEIESKGGTINATTPSPTSTE